MGGPTIRFNTIAGARRTVSMIQPDLQNLIACPNQYFLYSRNMESIAAIDQLSALAHTGRLAVFRLLVGAAPEGIAAGEIARQLDLPPNTLSAQLTILSQAGLVTSRREGRSIIYSADTGAISSLILYLMEDCCGGRPDICAPLRQTANKTASKTAC